MTLPLEKQVTSLELSKRLKELGASQESYFKWVDGELWDRTMQSDYETPGTAPRSEWIAAFTASELGEMFPEHISSERKEWGWQVFYKGSMISGVSAPSEVEARGLMLEYLITNNLIEI